MSDLLRKAFEKLESELPEFEQDALAKELFQFLESDERVWDAQFLATADKLDKLADRVLAQCNEGETEPLDPKRL
jgi:hypothetical protein